MKFETIFLGCHVLHIYVYISFGLNQLVIYLEDRPYVCLLIQADFQVPCIQTASIM